ncbi:MAG: hypothetical protein JWO71_581 [Candidatus Acidoferrum typicum]|nr:hypothetical protein [Candidatus Acidoferrum typicum]
MEFGAGSCAKVWMGVGNGAECTVLSDCHAERVSHLWR